MLLSRPTHCFPASAGAPGPGKAIARKEFVQLFAFNFFHLSRGMFSRGCQHSAVGRAPIPDSSDTSVSVRVQCKVKRVLRIIYARHLEARIDLHDSYVLWRSIRFESALSRLVHCMQLCPQCRRMPNVSQMLIRFDKYVKVVFRFFVRNHFFGLNISLI